MADLHFSAGSDTSTDHKTGSPTVSTSSGVATFSGEQTGDIGVGMFVDWDTDNKIMVLVSKVAGQKDVWNVQTKTGGTPPDLTGKTVNSIKHAFSSVNSAVQNVEGSSYANSTNWVTSQYKVHVQCYRDGSDDTTAVVLPDAITCNADYHLVVRTPYDTDTECNTRQRFADKKWTSGASVISVDNDYGINMDGGGPELTFQILEGLQIEIGGNTSARTALIGYNSHDAIIRQCFIRQKSGATQSHDGTLIRFTERVQVQNVIVTGFNNIGVNLEQPGNSYEQKYMNLSVYGNDKGVYTGSANTYQSGILDNIVVSGNSTYDWDNDPYSGWTGGTGNRCENNIDGGANVTSMNNQANNQVNKAAGDIWVDPANGDFTLKSGSPALDQGRTETEFSVDIGGETRPQGSAWDSGAIENEYIPTGGGAAQAFGQAFGQELGQE